MNGQSFLKGAIIISVGGFIAKLLGAIYRIPLTNVLGGEGMGIYQMVYPLYCLLLTVSATASPRLGPRNFARPVRGETNPACAAFFYARSLCFPRSGSSALPRCSSSPRS